MIGGADDTADETTGIPKRVERGNERGKHVVPRDGNGYTEYNRTDRPEVIKALPLL